MGFLRGQNFGQKGRMDLKLAVSVHPIDVIIGSPPGKPESMERTLIETDRHAHGTLFIGDANADQVAALM